MLALPLALLLGRAAKAQPPPWAGAAPSDLTRGLPPGDQQPPMLPAREYLDAYTLEGITDDGGALSISLILTNLAGAPPRPGFSVHWLPPGGGTKVMAEAEFPPETLRLRGPPLAMEFSGQRWAQSGQGWQLSLRAPATRAGAPAGLLELNLELTPTTPSYRRGNGRTPVGAGTFFMAVLFPHAKMAGTLTVGGKVVKIQGQAYADHSWQDVWAHHIARSWLNFRLFGGECSLAVTTWRAPGGEARSHALLARGGALVAASDQVQVKLGPSRVDPSSGYALPSQAQLDLGFGVIDLPLGAPADRQDLLANVPAVVKQFIQWFIARPYTYRFRTRAVADLSPAGHGRCEGEVLANLVFVNP